MADTFAPGVMASPDNAQAQRFGQLLQSASQVATQVTAKARQEAAFTTGVDAISKRLSSQEAVKAATKGQMEFANPMAEEAVRGAAYKRAARDVYNDLYEEWQTSDLNSKHPDVFADWLRQQLPIRMQEYGVETSDPDAARYFVPQMEAGFRSLTNQHNQQYIAYTNKQTRLDFATEVRGVVADAVHNAGADGVNVETLGQELEQASLTAGMAGISGGERDMLIAQNIVAQAMNEAASMDPTKILQATRILAAADTIRNGEYSKQANIQDVLRQAKVQVGDIARKSMESAQKRATAQSKARGEAGVRNIQGLLDQGKLGEAQIQISAMQQDPNITSADKNASMRTVANYEAYQKSLREATTVHTSPATLVGAQSAMSLATRGKDYEAASKVLADFASQLAPEDAARLKAQMVTELAAVEDDAISSSTTQMQGMVERVSKKMTSMFSMLGEGEQAEMNGLYSQLVSLKLSLTKAGSTIVDPKTNEKIDFRSLDEDAQYEYFVDQANKRSEDVFGKPLNAHLATLAERMRAKREETAANVKAATESTELADTMNAAAVALVNESKALYKKGADTILNNQYSPNNVTDEWQRNTFWESRPRLRPKADIKAINKQRDTLMQGLDDLANAGFASSEDSKRALVDAKKVLSSWANLDVQYGTHGESGQTREEFNKENHTLSISAGSPLGRMLVRTGNLEKYGFSAPSTSWAAPANELVNVEPSRFYATMGGKIVPIDGDIMVVPRDINKALSDLVAETTKRTLDNTTP